VVTALSLHHAKSEPAGPTFTIPPIRAQHRAALLRRRTYGTGPRDHVRRNRDDVLVYSTGPLHAI